MHTPLPNPLSFRSPPSSHPPRWSCPPERQPVPLVEQRKQRCWERVGAGLTRLEFVPCGARSARRRSQAAGTTRALRPCPASQRPPSIWLCPRSAGARELRTAARPSGSPAARAEPRRAPSVRSAPSHTRPARPVTQPGIGGARARPGWRRGDLGTRPSTCLARPCRSRSAPPVPPGPEAVRLVAEARGVPAVPAFPAARKLSPGGGGVALPQAPPTPRPRQGETF